MPSAALAESDSTEARRSKLAASSAREAARQAVSAAARALRFPTDTFWPQNENELRKPTGDQSKKGATSQRSFCFDLKPCDGPQLLRGSLLKSDDRANHMHVDDCTPDLNHFLKYHHCFSSGLIYIQLVASFTFFAFVAFFLFAPRLSILTPVNPCCNDDGEPHGVGEVADSG